jgi:sensor histidine kinase YesM
VQLAPRLKPWMLVSAAWIGPAILGALNVVAQQRLGGEPPPNAPALLFAAGDWLVYAVLTPAVFALSRRWPLARPRVGRHAVVHGAFSLAFCVAWAGAGAVLRSILMPEALAGGASLHFASWLFITLPFGVAVYLAVVGIEHAIRYLAEARDREVQVARLAEQLSSARFAALQAQLNPHFMFNTLNTIAVLVRDGDGAGATRIIEQLSDVLRRTLSRHRADEVTLDQELQLVRQYLAIEEARFSDRLRVEYAVETGALCAAIPGFAVQHLVENAVRHGIANRPEAGRVRIVARKEGAHLSVRVEDDGPGLDPAQASVRAHGLENTRERLRALYGDLGSLTVTRGAAGGAVAVLRVPFREMEAKPDDAGR